MIAIARGNESKKKKKKKIKTRTKIYEMSKNHGFRFVRLKGRVKLGSPRKMFPNEKGKRPGFT